MPLEWVGLGLCAIAIAGLLYNLYWGLQALMCPTHLGLAFSTVLVPASTWGDKESCSCRTWIRVRAHLRRQLVGTAAVLVLLYVWIYSLGSLRDLLITVIITIGILADARVMSLLRNDPEELKNYAKARQELANGQIAGAS